MISIHAPAWGATWWGRGWSGCGTYFNPRSRMGSDGRERRQRNGRAISIHAPAWGATRRGHTQAVGDDISIHAPAWGATDVLRHRRIPHRFQSTLPHGERLFRRGLVTNHVEFQSTLPHGERPLATSPARRRSTDFNPRSRMGSDQRAWRFSADRQPISIHAPAWGATRRRLLPRYRRRISIHAPAWGATINYKAPNPPKNVFQSTLPHGERPRPMSVLRVTVTYFNPRSRMGSDRSPQG